MSDSETESDEATEFITPDFVLPPKKKKYSHAQEASSTANPTLPQYDQVVKVEVYQHLHDENSNEDLPGPTPPQINQLVKVKVHQHLHDENSNEDLPGASGQTDVLTNAENCGQYRNRNVSTNAEKCRRYRSKLRAHALPALTSTERVREYRARKLALLPVVPRKLSQSSQQKTSTHRVRRFRERQKQLALQQKNHDAIMQLSQSSTHERRQQLSERQNQTENSRSENLNQEHSLREQNTDDPLLINSTDYQQINPILREVHLDHNYATSRTAQDVPYKSYNSHAKTHLEFKKNFKNNSFGIPCSVSERLCFESDLNETRPIHESTLKQVNFENITDLQLYSTCKTAIDKKKIENLSDYNGFKYLTVTSDLPKLYLVPERLISPRIPIMEIRITETRFNNEQRFNLTSFACIVQYKRDNFRSAGVAIYENTYTKNAVTSHMQVTLSHVVEIDVGQSDVGDICTAQCTLDDGRDIVMIVIYISPKQNIENIIKFLHRRLIMYSKLVSQELQSNLHEMPIILSGDFNVNFASEQAQPLIQFLNEKFELTMNNDPLTCTTKWGATIDAVFSRYLDKLRSTTYITYFSYPKPIISLLESKGDLTITEITVNNN